MPPNKPLTLYWIRHFPTDTAERYIGRSNVQARIPKDTFVPLPNEKIFWFSSPLSRAVQTAHHLMKPRRGDGKLCIAPELTEQHFGVWEGRRYDDVWLEIEHKYDWSKPEAVRPDGGESFEDVCVRVDSWLEKLLASHDASTVAIVAHAGSIRAGLRHSLRITPAEALAIQVEHGSVTQSTYTITNRAASTNC